MTDYSKLSDAEIAERVCRKLGAPVGEDYYANLLWATQQIPVHEDSFDFYRDYEDIEGTRKRLFAFLCFDWTAPIMMQKVKEWFEKADLEITASYDPVGRLWSYLIEKPAPECSCVAISRGEDPRALYEAFLQVEELQS